MPTKIESTDATQCIGTKARTKTSITFICILFSEAIIKIANSTSTEFITLQMNLQPPWLIPTSTEATSTMGTNTSPEFITATI